MNPALLGRDDEAIALISSQGDCVSYRALAAAIERGAAGLQVGAGQSVAVAVENPLGFVIAALAVWKSGAAVVPLDARNAAGWTQALVARARPAAVIRQASVEGELQLERQAEVGTVDPKIGMLLFTSGSSGPPKGVLLSRAGLLANVDAILAYLPVARFPRTAIVLPLCYSYALVGQVFTTLRAGATAILLGDLGFPPVQLQAMARLGAQGLSSVPMSLSLLAQAALETKTSLPLGYVASAGGALDLRTAGLLTEAFPTARRFNQYGLTEASPRVCALSDDEEPFARGSVGRPVAGTKVWEEDGELWVDGPSVMQGYLDDPAATAHALSPAGALRTGDQGHVDQAGYVFVTGRNDGLVKCGGERVSVEAVAEALSSASGCQVAVVALADERLGTRLVAVVAGDGEASVKRAARALPAAQRPARYVTVAALPRTVNGKLDLVALRVLAEPR